MIESNKIVCPKCAGTKHVNENICTKCCGIGIFYTTAGQPQKLSYHQINDLREFAIMNGWPKEFLHA